MRRKEIQRMAKETLINELEDELKVAFNDLQNALSRFEALIKRHSDEQKETETPTVRGCRTIKKESSLYLSIRNTIRFPLKNMIH